MLLQTMSLNKESIFVIGFQDIWVFVLARAFGFGYRLIVHLFQSANRWYELNGDFLQRWNVIFVTGNDLWVWRELF